MIRLFFLALSFLFLPLQAESEGFFLHKPALTQVPSCIATYKIVDLGETDLEVKQLTKIGQFDSLGPSINQKGQIIYNTSSGGIFRDPKHGETALSFNNVKAFARALNDKSEVVGSIHRPDKSIEWVFWSFKGCDTFRTPIASYSQDNWKLLFTSLANNGEAIGYRTFENRLEPIVWSLERPFVANLAEKRNINLQGFAIGVNRQSSILGYLDESADVHPFIMDSCNNFFVFKSFRTYLCCEGWVEPADMVLSDSGTLIGTYWLKYIGKDEDASKLGKYFAYRWNPYECRQEKVFEPLSLDSMRIAALNSADMLVGSLNEKAALSISLRPPFDLNLTVLAPDWDLLEATGINDSNEIVGYGTKNGKLHLFHLVPI